MERSEWVAGTELDWVTVRWDFNRDRGPGGAGLTITGYSKKRSHPLWTAYLDEKVHGTNLPAFLYALSRYIDRRRPTTGELLHQVIEGKRPDDPDPEPTLF